MFNLLSYFGVSLQSEIVVWSLFGIVLNVFDSSIFHFKSNLLLVWQMNMPSETFSLATKNFIKSIITAIVFAETFTVHLYLAAYIILLYPVLYDDRPGMALPWLLVAAVRRLLMGLLTLTTGLTACLLLPPLHAQPACSIFVFKYITRLAAAGYMWCLVYMYYCRLKVQEVFRAHAAEGDGIERAIRRRSAKSLYGEEVVRSAIHDMLAELPYEIISPTETLLSDFEESTTTSSASLVPPARDYLDAWLAGDLRLRRDSDRVNDQIAAMTLRVAAYLTCSKRCKSQSSCDHVMSHVQKLSGPSVTSPSSETPSTFPHFFPDLNAPQKTTDNIPKHVFSYLEEYPLIFMKQPDSILNSRQLSDVKSLMEQPLLFPQPVFLLNSDILSDDEFFLKKSYSESEQSTSNSNFASVEGASLTDGSAAVNNTCFKDEGSKK